MKGKEEPARDPRDAPLFLTHGADDFSSHGLCKTTTLLPHLRIGSYEPMAFQWEPNSKAPRARKFELTPLHLYVSQIEAMRAQY